jgi:hypothetical protein
MNSSQDLASSPKQNLALNTDLASNQDLTPTQINDISTHICKVREFLQENSNKQRITAARIHNLPELILQSSISRS